MAHHAGRASCSLLPVRCNLIARLRMVVAAGLPEQARAALSIRSPVERLHQTLKKWLARQDPAATITGLQAQLDAFTACYNTQRPHRGIGRQTPQAAWNARPRAIPARQGIRISEHFRVRRVRVDADGKLTLRHNSRLHHIGIGRRWSGTKVLILARDLELRIITQDNGELIRELTLNPARDYQAQAPKV